MLRFAGLTDMAKSGDPDRPTVIEIVTEWDLLMDGAVPVTVTV